MDKYDFQIGDEVITVDGVRGKVVNICTCVYCQRRGFYEPIWIADDDEKMYEHNISNWDASNGFDEYYKIGKYRFNNPLCKSEVFINEITYHKRKIAKIKSQMKVIRELLEEEAKTYEVRV